MIRFIQLFFVLALYVGTSFAQKYAFRTYSTSDGLPQSQVNSICQDDDGFLWIGTLGGVARFNGDYFKTFSSENGLHNNRVSCVTWLDKSIWVGHDGGVSMIKDSKVISISFPEKYKATPVSDIVKFKNEIIISLNGGGLLKVKGNKTLEIIGMKEKQIFVRDLQVVNDVLYIATKQGVLSSKDLKTFEVILPTAGETFSSVLALKNELVFSSFSEGIFYYNLTNGSMKVRKLSDPDLRVFNMTIDQSNTLWLCTQKGVIRIVDDVEDLIDFDRGLPTNTVSCVFEDQDRNMWMGTQGKGLVRSPRGGMIYFDNDTGLATDLIISGFQEKSGPYFFGTFDIGVVKKSGVKDFQVFTLPFNNTVWSAQADVDGKNWFGTKESLLSIDKSGKISVEDRINTYKTTCFYKISQNSMYIGGSKGVVRYEKGKFSELAKNSSDIGTARNILMVDKRLFVASDLGLYELKNKQLKLVNDFDKTVFSLSKNEDNILFFGTEDGLYQFKDDKITRIRFASELASNYINFLNYRNGVLYVGTNNGLYLISGVDFLKNPKVIQVGLTDGLIDLETNLNSSFFDNKGDFWFGTSAGLVRFNPKKFTSFKPNIKLKLRDILLNYQSTDFTKYSDKVDNNGIPKNLVLPYDENNLLFNFDGISISRFSNLDFQYWLEGLEQTWSPPSKNTSVSFSSLPSGDYILHARILDSNGNANDEITFSFTVKAPFYATWWFISLLVLAIGGIVIAFFRFRIKREKEISANEMVSVKARLVSLEQQSLNASMNRHFIFNSLNSIQYFINTSDKLAANKYLTNFAKLIRKNLDSSAEKNSMVTLAQEMERIELYLSLESMRFKDRFDFSIQTDDVDLESISIPAMLIQPFVENSIIHGILPNEEKKGTILIKAYYENEDLYILVEDNGIGIDKSISQKQSLTGDHKSQGMEITVKRIDLIRLVSNQHLELIGPQQINNSDSSINGTRVLLKITQENLEK